MHRNVNHATIYDLNYILKFKLKKLYILIGIISKSLNLLLYILDARKHFQCNNQYHYFKMTNLHNHD